MRNRLQIVFVLVMISSLYPCVRPAAAHNIDQPGDGHLLGTGQWGTIEKVGHLELGGAADDIVGDVAVSADGNWAFVASRAPIASRAGVWVVDISNAQNPQLAKFIPSAKETRPGEGMQVVELTTPLFNGRVLVINAEPISKNGIGGITLIDVTNALKPVQLMSGSFGKGPAKGVATDGAFAWDAGANAYAALSPAGSTDVDVLDITNPRRPRRIASFNVEQLFTGGIDQPALGLDDTYITDILVRQIGAYFIMIVSANDGGHVLLDVTNPAAVVAIAHTEYDSVDPQLLESTGIFALPEGNAHYAELTASNAFLVGCDYDLVPFGGSADGFDGWGYVHLYDSNFGFGAPQRVDTFAIPEAQDPAYGTGFGVLSVHEAANHPQLPDRSYLAYRAGGFRKLEIQQVDPNDPTTAELVETGGYLGPDGNDFWGIEAFVKSGTTYILASDREFGLYIFRDTTAGP